MTSSYGMAGSPRSSSDHRVGNTSGQSDDVGARNPFWCCAFGGSTPVRRRSIQFGQAAKGTPTTSSRTGQRPRPKGSMGSGCFELDLHRFEMLQLGLAWLSQQWLAA